MNIFPLLLFLFSALISTAQTTNQKPCASPEASQLDFWVGDWNLTWSDSLHGTNHIEKLYGNCTVHENFADSAGNFYGQSWSVYNSNSKQWQQTWIDNQGGYIVLTGGKVGDSIVLKTVERTVPLKISPSGKMMNRMVFYNITADVFDWSWEVSVDSGVSWKQNWKIHYIRKS
jgi:hypothetical protein